MADDQAQPTPGAKMRVTPNLDSVRGLACLLVVALHVVGDSEATGLQLPITSGWHYAMTSIAFLRIPLFTAMSGYLYAGRRVSRHEFPGFWVKKSRRLFVPFIFMTWLLWWLRSYSNHPPEAQTSLLHDWLFETSHLWFIQALIILFLGISITDAFFRSSTVGLVLAGLVAIMVSQSGFPVTLFLGISGAFYLAPYFLLGIILREHPEYLRNPRNGIFALGIIVIVLISQQLGLLGLTNNITVLQMPAAMAGMAGVVFFLQRFPVNPMLARIGAYSYTVYLWHVVASAAVRTVLIKVGVTSVPTLFVLCFIAAVVAPIVLYHVARRVPLLTVAVTGERRLASRSRLLRAERRVA